MPDDCVLYVFLLKKQERSPYLLLNNEYTNRGKNTLARKKATCFVYKILVISAEKRDFRTMKANNMRAHLHRSEIENLMSINR